MKSSSVYNKNWRRRNPQKAAAHIAVNNAIKTGRLVKMPCEKCKSPLAHAHHDDYGKKLDVRWLCKKCHDEHHYGSIEDRKKREIATRKAYQKKRNRPLKGRPSPRRSVLAAPAWELRKQGKPYKEIAKILGTTKGQVYKWLNNVSYG
jgi:RNase P subunit RPR2